jgi:hypothetical protein
VQTLSVLLLIVNSLAILVFVYCIVLEFIWWVGGWGGRAVVSGFAANLQASKLPEHPAKPMSEHSCPPRKPCAPACSVSLAQDCPAHE